MYFPILQNGTVVPAQTPSENEEFLNLLANNISSDLVFMDSGLPFVEVSLGIRSGFESLDLEEYLTFLEDESNYKVVSDELKSKGIILFVYEGDLSISRTEDFRQLLHVEPNLVKYIQE
jgi:hypothetical protein